MVQSLTLDIDGAVARIALNRPEKRNAIDQAMWEAIPPAIEKAAVSPGVRLIVLSSSTPGMFSAGADIGEFARQAGDTAWQMRNRAAIRAAQVALTRVAVPTLAAIDGDCVGGGCGLALACDIRVASTRARFGITPAKLGLVYPLHDTKLLVDLVGPGQAKRMLYTGELLSADEAFAIGLIERVATVDEFLTAVADVAAAVTANSPFSTRGIKRTVQRILDGVRDDDSESAAMFDAAFAGADFAEGVAAFQARRAPEFRGR